MAAYLAPLQETPRLAPDSAQARFGLGSVYAAQNRYDEAARWFNEALRVEPNHAPAHQSLAQLFELQGKKDAALHHYQEAVRLMRQSGAGGASR